MTVYAFPPPPQAAVPITGSAELFPVRRVFCVGRNYAAHRREMGGEDRDPPFFFAKPADAVVPLGGAIAYPSSTAEYHHEVELVVALGGGGEAVAAQDALALVFGFAVGVDLTRRDLQAAARAKGQPWEAAKGFDRSAPIGAIRRAAGPAPAKGISLCVDGAVRQRALISDMIWSVPEILAQASRLWRLAPGDLIFTGTPEGVGPLARGEAIHAEIEDVGSLDFTIV